MVRRLSKALLIRTTTASLFYPEMLVVAAARTPAWRVPAHPLRLAPSRAACVRWLAGRRTGQRRIHAGQPRLALPYVSVGRSGGRPRAQAAELVPVRERRQMQRNRNQFMSSEPAKTAINDRRRTHKPERSSVERDDDGSLAQIQEAEPRKGLGVRTSILHLLSSPHAPLLSCPRLPLFASPRPLPLVCSRRTSYSN